MSKMSNAIVIFRGIERRNPRNVDELSAAMRDWGYLPDWEHSDDAGEREKSNWTPEQFREYVEACAADRHREVGIYALTGPDAGFERARVESMISPRHWHRPDAEDDERKWQGRAIK